MKVDRHNLDDIPKLLDIVHDKYFDFQQIQFNSHNHYFMLPIGSTKHSFEMILSVDGANGYHLKDTEQIGIYYYAVQNLSYTFIFIYGII